MSDKWISVEVFTDKVEEVREKLSQRWENIHACDVVHGFFYCCDDKDSKGYRMDMKVRVCDGCGDDLYPTTSVASDFHCTECEMWYSGIDGNELRPPNEWGRETGESFNNKGEII